MASTYSSYCCSFPNNYNALGTASFRNNNKIINSLQRIKEVI